MALGTRAPNERKLTNVCAGLPRDLNTRVPTKTFTRLRAVFCPKITTKTAPKHRTQERRSQAFNASNKRRPDKGVRWRPKAGTNLIALLAGGNEKDQSLANSLTACSAALAPPYADAL
jgi:hypothetical protein